MDTLAIRGGRLPRQDSIKISRRSQSYLGPLEASISDMEEAFVVDDRCRLGCIQCRQLVQKSWHRLASLHRAQMPHGEALQLHGWHGRLSGNASYSYVPPGPKTKREKQNT